MNRTIAYKEALIISVICIITFFCFHYSLQNQFTNWDDDYYVTNDQYIRAFTPHNLKVIFTEDITKNNYHPLCMLSLAVNYHFSQLNPMPYYLTNILIHLANAILVFFLFIQLCRRINMNETGRLFIASFGSLWFAIHPMHVESVSWIAERKDVLYTLFYLFALLAYLRYTSSGKKSWYWGTFFLFVASCLSKPMAVMFPLSLLCIDVLLQRPWNKKLFTEKAVFFAASLFFGGLAVYTQNRTGAVASFATLSVAERFMFASYGYVMYIVKLFYPVHLSTFYPYPLRYIGGSLPVIYYVSPVIVAAIIILPLYISYKKNKAIFRVVAFGLGFFTFNIMHVLQFLSVGAAIMADRYSYLPYIGLFFLIAYLIYGIILRFPATRTVVFATLMVFSGTLAYLCYERTYAWHDSETLTSDAIEEFPYRALLSYKWRGHYYNDKGEVDKALADYNVLVMMRTADAKIYDKIGNLYIKKGDYTKAIDAFNSSIEKQNNVYKTYVDRANAYTLLGDTLKAAQDYLIAGQLNPDIEKVTAEFSFNLVQSGRFEEAIKKYDELIQINPNNAFYYFYRGVAEFSTNRKPQAITDWEKGMTFNTRDVLQSASYNLSVVYHQLGKDSLAAYYVLKAKDLGYKVNPTFADSLVREYEMHKRQTPKGASGR